MEKLNIESRRKIDEIVLKHKDKMGPVKLMLHDVQSELGYIPFEAMEESRSSLQRGTEAGRKISVGASFPFQ